MIKIMTVDFIDVFEKLNTRLLGPRLADDEDY